MKKTISEEVDEMMSACAFQPRYSGSASRKFWAEIKKSDDRALYDCGLVLQDVESRVLATVNAFMRIGLHGHVSAQRKRKSR